MTAPELLALEMPLVRRITADLLALGYVEDSAAYNAMFTDMVKFHRWFGWSVQPQGESK